MKTYDWFYAGLTVLAVLYVLAWWWMQRLIERRKLAEEKREVLHNGIRMLQRSIRESELVLADVPARRYGLRHDDTDQWVIRREVMGRWQFELVEHPVQWWPLGEALMIRRDAEEILGQVALEPLPVVVGEPGAN